MNCHSRRTLLTTLIPKQQHIIEDVKKIVVKVCETSERGNVK